MSAVKIIIKKEIQRIDGRIVYGYLSSDFDGFNTRFRQDFELRNSDIVEFKSEFDAIKFLKTMDTTLDHKPNYVFCETTKNIYNLVKNELFECYKIAYQKKEV